MSAGKRLPQEKSLLRNMPLRRRPQRKNLHRPLTSCRSAQNARQRRKEQRNTGGGNLALPGEQKNFQRLAHGSGKKLAMEKEADQMRRIAPRHRKERTPCPCCMAGVKGIFQGFRVTPRQGGGRRSPAECSRRNIRFPGETPPRQGIRQAASSGRKVHPAGKPPGQARRRKIPIGGLCPPFSLQQVSPPGPVPHDKKPTPPGRNTNRSTQAGPRYAESRYRPFHKETCSARLRVLCMCPPPTGKRLSPIPRREGCGIFSLPAGKRTKKPCRGGRSAP